MRGGGDDDTDTPAAQVVAAAKRLSEEKLNKGTSGNVSIRVDAAKYIITPRYVVVTMVMTTAV